MTDKRRDKRWKREHRGRSRPTVDCHLVYRPATHAEALRRAQRAQLLIGTPFVSLPVMTEDRHEVLFRTTDGSSVTVEAVEMVFNDALLCDAVSGWGKDGPLYRDTITGRDLEIFEYALKAYAGVPIPEQLKRTAQSGF